MQPLWSPPPAPHALAHGSLGHVGRRAEPWDSRPWSSYKQFLPPAADQTDHVVPLCSRLFRVQNILGCLRRVVKIIVHCHVKILELAGS